MPGLIWRLAVEILGRQPIEDVDGGHHHLSQEDGWHAPMLEQGTHHRHHHLVVAFDDAVLLRGVGAK